MELSTSIERVSTQRAEQLPSVNQQAYDEYKKIDDDDNDDDDNDDSGFNTD